MRWLYLVAALVGLSACGAPQATPTDTAEAADAVTLASFDFRGLKPDVTTQEEAIAAGTVNCEFLGCRFEKYGIGDVGTSDSMIVFKDGKFDWFSVKMHPDSFELMGQNLVDVYGQPCRADSNTLQNAFGATFSGDELEWCFKEGHLTLRRHSENDVTKGELDFFTYREPPPAVDYNSGNL